MYKQLFFYCAFFLLACEKDKIVDSTSAQIAIVHASTSMGEVELAFGETNTISLNYEEISGNPGNIYNALTSGIQRFSIHNAAGSFKEDNLSYFTPGTKNTIFLYDTISSQQERKPALFKISDPVKALNPSVDSGWVRFIHLATGIDSIAAILIKENTTDTLWLAAYWRQPSLYNNPNALAPFRGPLKTGNYRVAFFDKEGFFFYGLTDLEVKAGKSMTIYSYGAYNPAAQRKMEVKEVFNN